MSRRAERKAWAADRLLLDDGTLWPAPYASAGSIVHAYRELLTHPWGVSASCHKIRMLRRAYMRMISARP